MIIAGTISGSSLDGLDIAICRFKKNDKGIDYEVLYATTIDFPEELSSQLKSATNLTPKQLLELDFQFAKYSAGSLAKIIDRCQILPDYIASHGHTVFHAPERGYSFQIGNGGTIAASCGIPVISDFRMNDIALGGQGAPITPIVEQYLLKGYDYYLNLGGIANISVHADEIISYDVCPCNQILNAEAQKLGLSYDPQGENAAQGTANSSLIRELRDLEYFELDYPKSLDNSWVMTTFYDLFKKYNLSPKDALSTMTEFVAEQIAKDVSNLSKLLSKKSQKMIVTGGGAHNSFLFELLNNKLTKNNGVIVKPTDQIVNMKEAILMSLMGFLRVHNIPNNIPSVTGASRSSVGGAIYMP